MWVKVRWGGGAVLSFWRHVMSDDLRKRALADLEKAVAGLQKLAGRVEQGDLTRNSLAKELMAMYGTFSMLVRALR
jgi:hypothetical protein